MRTTGTIARGVRAPLFKAGDNVAQIVAQSVLNTARVENFSLRDRDVVAVTEAVVARAQGNYATSGQIAADIRNRFPDGTLAITLPILSRNRFFNILKGIALGCDRLYIMLSYPSDEVGNHLVSWDAIDKAGVNPYTDVLNEGDFRRLFGQDTRHFFTDVDYVELYKSLGDHIEIIFANDVRSVLQYTKNVLCCDIHTRARSKRLLKEAGADIVLGLDDILTGSIDGSGFNPQYGLLGSNAATVDSVKLFPRDCRQVVDETARILRQASGKQIEVMVYGDGAFKDPAAKIWELADPVVSPAFTSGLEGKPNELKMKYLLDNELSSADEDSKMLAVEQAIRQKTDDLGIRAMGTTPRMYADLLGSLCDLVSGSGDKGTPIVLVQGYFDSFTDL